MAYARQIGADDFSLLKAANSGDTAGGKDRVVGYLSAVLSKPQQNRPVMPPQDPESATTQQDTGDSMLTLQDKKRLLEIARQTIAAHAAGKPLPVFQETAAGLNLKRGCFVTLREHGNLRGCIGLFTSDEPLYRSVQAMAVASSSQDYRFSPVRPQEMKDIVIEISVLSEPALIDDWKKIRLGTDGVIVRRGFSSGVFLPQVAAETGWNLETFLGELCSQKAGLAPDCYKDPQTKIYTFQADVFSEEETSH
jgi:AmmeMemoRadiSam system protein A